MFTLEKRLRLEERSRDLAEENVRREVSSCQGLLQVRAPPPMDLNGQSLVSLGTSGQCLEELELVEFKSVVLQMLKKTKNPEPNIVIMTITLSCMLVHFGK